uniref:Endonuclease/exonuclease/phosphatase domain-containing protein n=1 Tax=Odontella aurita TaxID=265563 RepID=A0A7S4N0U1_9STRA|mmetsp:Transcript_42815/g.130217  ORF Transcript_42815/g.130217 Transcript_42815/m.130217 type:complete len:121 (+) Transcript_42815:727-1089(+)
MSLAPNDTTKTQRICCYLSTFDGRRAINILNIYVPPIHGSAQGERTQKFSAERTFGAAIEAAEVYEYSIGILIAGDFNAHYHDWYINSEEDALGFDIADFAIYENNSFMLERRAGNISLW